MENSDLKDTATAGEQEWTETQLHELVMDLLIEAGYLENLHRKFFDRLKPWFDKHNAAIATAYEKGMTDAREATLGYD